MKRLKPKMPEQRPSFVHDPYYQRLLRECEDRERQADNISNMKINMGGGLHFQALQAYLIEIRLLRQLRHAYIEHFINTHPGAKTLEEVIQAAHDAFAPYVKPVNAKKQGKPTIILGSLKKPRQSKSKKGA